MKEILTEIFDLDLTQVIVEDEGGDNGKLVLKNVLLQRSDRKNANGRSYPRKIWERELARHKDRVGKRQMIGELDHPMDGKTSLKRGSHLIVRAELQEDGTVIGDLEILDDAIPNAKITRGYIRSKVQLGVSSRGAGTLGKDGIVSEDYELDTWDIVSKPSTEGAYLPELDTRASAAAGARESVREPDSPSISEEVKAKIAEVVTANLGKESVDSLTERLATLGRLEEAVKADSGLLLIVRGFKDRVQGIISARRLVESVAPGLGAPEPTRQLESINDGGHKMTFEELMKRYEASVKIIEDLLSRNETAKAEITALKEQAASGSGTVDEGVQKKLTAAESIIEELVSMLKERPEGDTEQTEGLKKRLDAATQIIDEFIKQSKALKESSDGTASQAAAAEALVQGLVDAYQGLEYRYEAAEELIEATLDKYKKDKVSMRIMSLLETVGNPEDVRPFLEDAQSVEEVDERFARIRSMAGGSYTDLPVSGNRNGSLLTEGAGTGSRDPQADLALKLARKMGGK